MASHKAKVFGSLLRTINRWPVLVPKRISENIGKSIKSLVENRKKRKIYEITCRKWGKMGDAADYGGVVVRGVNGSGKSGECKAGGNGRPDLMAMAKCCAQVLSCIEHTERDTVQIGAL
jgi:hypothetical protein